MPSLTRRKFLALCGATTAGILLPGTSVFALPGRMVLKLTGPCSFCGKLPTEVYGLAGVAGHDVRICDECIGLCLDIIAEEEHREVSPSRSRMDIPSRDELESLLSQLGANPSASQLDALFDRIRGELEPKPSSRARVRNMNLSCSFCDRHQREVKKLIAGPSVYVCDDCVADASALFARSGLRR
jgi:hypothetical protein